LKDPDLLTLLWPCEEDKEVEDDIDAWDIFEDEELV